MNKLACSTALAFGLLISPAAFAAEKTITLTVSNMDCADCPFIVRKSLVAVPGVAKASVSYKDKTVIVTYDDGRADIEGLADGS